MPALMTELVSTLGAVPVWCAALVPGRVVGGLRHYGRLGA